MRRYRYQSQYALTVAMILSLLAARSAWADGLSLGSVPVGMQQQSEGADGTRKPIKLRIQQLAIPEVSFPEEQLTPAETVAEYEARMAPLRRTLQRIVTTLDAKAGQGSASNPGSGQFALQRFSALVAEASLQWRMMEASTPAAQKEWRSYRHMQEAVVSLQTLRQYRMTHYQARQVLRLQEGSTFQEEAALRARQQEVAALLETVLAFASFKGDLNSNRVD